MLRGFNNQQFEDTASIHRWWRHSKSGRKTTTVYTSLPPHLLNYIATQALFF